MSRTLVPFVLTSLAVLAWSGCQPKVKVAAEVDPAGTYTLKSVDGAAVPATVKHGQTAITVRSGTFVIDAAGGCVSRIVFALPDGREAAREVKASYTRQGATLTMKWEGAGTTTGTVDGPTFSMTNEGMVFVYRR